MPSERRCLWCVLCAWAAVALSTPSAGGQEIVAAPAENAGTNEEKRWEAERRAVRLGHEGLALYERSLWEEAYGRFQAADELVHSPVFLLYMARCRRNSGKLLEAKTLFERVSAERISGQSPPAWHGAIADASAELIALRRAIPHLVVIVREGAGSGTRVRLDGRELAPSQLGKPIEVDPGRHFVVARDSGGREVLETVDLAEAEPPRAVQLSFDASAGRQRENASSGDSGEAWRTLGFVVLGVGAAGVGVGIGTAVVAATRDSSEDAREWGAWSIASFIGGGAIAGAGALILILSPSRGASAANAGRARNGLRTDLRIGVSAVSIRGSF